MRARTDGQRAAFDFLLAKFRAQEPFERGELERLTRWTRKSLNTYLSKQFRGFLVTEDDVTFRVTEAFRKYATWRSFRELVTQKRPAPSDYTRLAYDNVIIFDFFMPLTHEHALRGTLDALFYQEEILSRLRTVDSGALASKFPRQMEETIDTYLVRICNWISERFVGYSINHVAGRFRAGDLRSAADAYQAQLSTGDEYLVDETTAIVRFIFPCGEPTPVPVDSAGNSEPGNPDAAAPGTTMQEADLIRWVFDTIFVRSMVQLVSGEDQIWLLESGLRHRLHKWVITPET